MIFVGLIHYLNILILLTMAIQGAEGIMCEADFCHRVDCSYQFQCLPGFKPAAQATECGCCPACVQTLDEGRECSHGPSAYHYANGSYTMDAYPPVCKNGFFCSKDVTNQTCKPLSTCQADTCDSRRTQSQCASKRTCSPGFKSVLYADDCGCCSKCVETLDEGSRCFLDSRITRYANGVYTWRDYQTTCKDGLYCVQSNPYPICKRTKPDTLCERDTCRFVRCANVLQCLPGLMYVPQSSCGCCGMCVEALDEGSACLPGPYRHTYENGTYTLTVRPSNCKDGLYCAKDATNPVCRVLQPENCAHRREVALDKGSMPGQYVPQCNEDGSYRAKQCGPGPVCHCVNEQNVRIGQYSARIWEADNMTCLCAREQLVPDDIMECTQLGNFYGVGVFNSGRILSHAGLTSLLLIVNCLRLLLCNV